MSVVLLAYSEEENLRALLPLIRQNVEQTGEEYEIIVVDTEKPTDHTKDVCLLNKARYINQEEPAFGGAFRTGIKHARMDKFLIMDGDGSHDPSVIPAMYHRFMQGYDVVIGSRYVKGGTTHDAMTSVMMSRILNAAFRICLGIRARDISTNFRLYHTGQLKRTVTTCTNYDVLQEILFRLKRLKPDLAIAEVPITFRKRAHGQSKRRLLPFVVSYAQTLCHLALLRLAKTDEKQRLMKNIVLYAVFGVIAAGLEYAVFSTLISTALSRQPEWANLIGSLSGFAFAFVANTFLNFKKRDKVLRRLISYGLICLLGLAISTGCIHLLKDRMNLYLLKAILMVAVSALQFVLNRAVTYRE